jgi:hypothetical protein
MLVKLEIFETGDLVNRFCITPVKQRSKTENLWDMVNTLYIKNSILLSQTLTVVVLHIFNESSIQMGSSPTVVRRKTDLLVDRVLLAPVNGILAGQV